MDDNNKENIRPGNIIISSIIGGILGGIVMVIVLMIGAMTLSLPPTAFPMVMGMALGASINNAIIVGIIAHFVVSIVIGVIFGAIVSYIRPLNLKSSKKALGLGLDAGLIVYLVAFIPVAMFMFAPVMIHMMGSSAATILPDVLGIAVIGHILYGLILGISAFKIGVRLS